jgi:hypothetical protein
LGFNGFQQTHLVGLVKTNQETCKKGDPPLPASSFSAHWQYMGGLHGFSTFDFVQTPIYGHQIVGKMRFSNCTTGFGDLGEGVGMGKGLVVMLIRHSGIALIRRRNHQQTWG